MVEKGISLVLISVYNVTAENSSVVTFWISPLFLDFSAWDSLRKSIRHNQTDPKSFFPFLDFKFQWEQMALRLDTATELIQCHRGTISLFTCQTWPFGIVWRSYGSGAQCTLWDLTKVQGRGGHMGCLSYHTDSCHFSFPWLSLRFKLTFLATGVPCGSCKAQMSSWRNVAHLLFTDRHVSLGQGSWQLSCRSSSSLKLVMSAYVGRIQSVSFTFRKIKV